MWKLATAQSSGTWTSVTLWVWAVFVASAQLGLGRFWPIHPPAQVHHGAEMAQFGSGSRREPCSAASAWVKSAHWAGTWDWQALYLQSFPNLGRRLNVTAQKARRAGGPGRQLGLPASFRPFKGCHCNPQEFPGSTWVWSCSELG